MKSETPTETQLEALLAMARDDAPLERRHGGFWTTRGMPESKPGVPDWYVGTQTVRALERKGLVRRAGRHAEGWRDEREMTDEGREAALAAAPAGPRAHGA